MGGILRHTHLFPHGDPKTPLLLPQIIEEDNDPVPDFFLDEDAGVGSSSMDLDDSCSEASLSTILAMAESMEMERVREPTMSPAPSLISDTSMFSDREGPLYHEEDEDEEMEEDDYRGKKKMVRFVESVDVVPYEVDVRRYSESLKPPHESLFERMRRIAEEEAAAAEAAGDGDDEEDDEESATDRLRRNGLLARKDAGIMNGLGRAGSPRSFHRVMSGRSSHDDPSWEYSGKRHLSPPPPQIPSHPDVVNAERSAASNVTQDTQSTLTFPTRKQHTRNHIRHLRVSLHPPSASTTTAAGSGGLNLPSPTHMISPPQSPQNWRVHSPPPLPSPMSPATPTNDTHMHFFHTRIQSPTEERFEGLDGAMQEMGNYVEERYVLGQTSPPPEKMRHRSPPPPPTTTTSPPPPPPPPPSSEYRENLKKYRDVESGLGMPAKKEYHHSHHHHHSSNHNYDNNTSYYTGTVREREETQKQSQSQHHHNHHHHHHRQESQQQQSRIPKPVPTSQEYYYHPRRESQGGTGTTSTPTTTSTSITTAAAANNINIIGGDQYGEWRRAFAIPPPPPIVGATGGLSGYGNNVNSSYTGRTYSGAGQYGYQRRHSSGYSSSGYGGKRVDGRERERDREREEPVGRVRRVKR